MAGSVGGLLIDLDGTIYYKEALIPGAALAVERLRKMGYVLRFLTNTDSKTASAIQNNLDAMGLPVELHEIFTPLNALVRFSALHPGADYHLLVTSELKEYLNEVVRVNSESPRYVVVGDMREHVDYNTLNHAFQLIMNGSEIIALQEGRFFMRENGYNIDTGAFVRMFEYASGKEAILLGKPSAEFYRLALHDLGLRPQQVVVVGDDITTDLVGAKAIGSRVVMVKTGKYSLQDRDRVSETPDFVIESIADLPDLLSELE